MQSYEEKKQKSGNIFIVILIHLALLQNGVNGIGEKDINKQLENDAEKYQRDNFTPKLGLTRLDNKNEKYDLQPLEDYKQLPDSELKRYIVEEDKWTVGGAWYNPMLPLAAPLVNADVLFDSEWYYAQAPSIFIFHDKCSSWFAREIRLLLRAFALKWLHRYYNIFVFDFPAYKCSSMDSAFSKLLRYKTDTPWAIQELVKFFENGFAREKIAPHLINIIGYGDAAILAGRLAKRLNKRIQSVIGLDPPHNEPFPEVTEDDAEILQIYHTSYLKSHFDLKKTDNKRHGKVDFYITYERHFYKDPCLGIEQEKCKHYYSFAVFIGVSLKSKRFTAWKCDSLYGFEREHEDCNKESARMSYPPTHTPSGMYFIRIIPKFPYGLGMDGNKFDMNTIIKNEDEYERCAIDPAYFAYLHPDEVQGGTEVKKPTEYIEVNPTSTANWAYNGRHTEKIKPQILLKKAQMTSENNRASGEDVSQLWDGKIFYR